VNGGSLATRLVDGIAACDESAIAACFSEDAEFSALVPAGLRERQGAGETAALIAGWFGDSTELELVDSRADEIGDRLHVTYRLQGVEEGEPYVVEQHLFCTLDGGRIVKAGLLCSGFRPRPAR
jgi:ketosteroid isomerase-like protein